MRLGYLQFTACTFRSCLAIGILGDCQYFLEALENGGFMTNQEQGEVILEGKQKVAPEVEVDTSASDDSENPEDPISEESEVPRTNDAPAD